MMMVIIMIGRYRHPSRSRAGSWDSGWLRPRTILFTCFRRARKDITLPFTGVTLQGLDVEPSTLTDFHGASAVAFHVGEAKGSDGHTYNLETDIRVMEGKYVAVDGTTRHGSFALI